MKLNRKIKTIQDRKTVMLSSQSDNVRENGIFIKATSLITFIAIMVTTTPQSTGAVVIRAVIEFESSRENFINLFLEKMDHIIDYKRNLTSGEINLDQHGNGHKETDWHIDIATPTLIKEIESSRTELGVKRFLFHGNITENKTWPKSMIRFQFYTESINSTISTKSETGADIRWPTGCDGNNNEKNKLAYDRGSDRENNNYSDRGGLLDPIVNTIEPYVVTLLNVIFHGIMTSVITKIMENANMTGDLSLI